MIKSHIKNVQDMPWPQSPKEVSQQSIYDFVPVILFNFLACLINGKSDQQPDILSLDKYVNVSANIERQTLAICQDIVYCSRCGRIHTPKHVLLAVSVHHVTCSMELVNILNYFGHCISKTKLQEPETALAYILKMSMLQ